MNSRIGYENMGFDSKKETLKRFANVHGVREECREVRAAGCGYE